MLTNAPVETSYVSGADPEFFCCSAVQKALNLPPPLKSKKERSGTVMPLAQ